MIGIHTGGFRPARDPEAARAAVERLGIEYPVVIDERLELWDFYGNEGWPARYLWDTAGALYSMHYGEGAYDGDRARDPGAARRRARARAAAAARGRRGRPAAGADRRPARRLLRPLRGGRGVGGARGQREVRVERRATIAVDGPGAYPLLEHGRHTRGELELEVGAGVTCHATCFTPALP